MKNLLQKYKALPDKRAVLLQSGGLDSCVCDALVHQAGFEVTELFVDYGQSALEKEWAMSQEMCDLYGHKLIRVSIDLPWLKTLPIVGGTVESTGVEEIKRGVVDPESYIPLRNQILLSIAGSLAESLQIRYVCTGLNGSQNILGKPRDGFVDTHPNFAKALEISHKLVQLRSLGVAVRCETAGSATAFILLLKIRQSLFVLSAFLAHGCSYNVLIFARLSHNGWCKRSIFSFDKVSNLRGNDLLVDRIQCFEHFLFYRRILVIQINTKRFELIALVFDLNGGRFDRCIFHCTSISGLMSSP